ncbi:MAG: COQ9 family protein [Alphaproteobacteria bacterium]|tara:strand:+ start:85 stop:711 length:627 start_codon:yes stop_codon:yes gene_type:complete
MKSKQDKLANLFIQEVPKFGWSRETLLHCAKKQKLSTPNLALMFPSFEYDVLKHLIAQNNSLVEKNYNSFNNSRLKTRDKIKTIMELKFDSNAYLKDALPEMLKFLLRPGNIFMSIKMLHQNSDFIWKLAGDKSNDFNYYSKRGLLSMVYLATLIYWLNDKSNKGIGTKNFISKSVDGIVDGVSKFKQLNVLRSLAQNFFSRFNESKT